MSNEVPFSKSNDEAQERLLLEPFAYLMQFPGKDVRVKLLHAFNVWLQVDETKVREIGKCFYFTYNFVCKDVVGSMYFFDDSFSLFRYSCANVTQCLPAFG